jgi:hypothetical protein
MQKSLLFAVTALMLGALACQGDSFEAPASGNLYLRVNDCDAGLYDNHGSLRILVLP